MTATPAGYPAAGVNPGKACPGRVSPDSPDQPWKGMLSVSPNFKCAMPL